MSVRNEIDVHQGMGNRKKNPQSDKSTQLSSNAHTLNKHVKRVT